MDARTISDGLLAILVGMGSLGAALSSSGRRARARSKQQACDLEELIDYTLAQRAKERRHNAEEHPTGKGEIPITPLPDSMMRGTDA